jgi:uncharacterized membrane protein
VGAARPTFLIGLALEDLKDSPDSQVEYDLFAMAVLDILMRYLHVVTACLAVGGAFFIRFLLPIGTRDLEAEAKDFVLLRSRRAFKMVVHPAMLAFIVSGVYNSWRLFPQYKVNPPMLHSLWGTHILIALVIFGISIILLKGVEPPRNHRTWMKVNVALMFVVILVASSLKWAREHENPRVTPTKNVPATSNSNP